jgi:gas vesicle protein
MRITALFLIGAIGVASGLFFAPNCTSAQEVRRSKEGENWNKWAMKHQKWIDEHPKKAEYYQNHPDAAQRFINNWNRNHGK